jgi:fructoselysine-6-P-deglycase FrlB-like protein
MISLSGQVLIMLPGSALAAGTCVGAHAEVPAEYEVKAAFIHTIARFVEWLAMPNSNLRQGGVLLIASSESGNTRQILEALSRAGLRSSSQLPEPARVGAEAGGLK